jgi:hypothetical protein
MNATQIAKKIQTLTARSARLAEQIENAEGRRGLARDKRRWAKGQAHRVASQAELRWDDKIKELTAELAEVEYELMGLRAQLADLEGAGQVSLVEVELVKAVAEVAKTITEAEDAAVEDEEIFPRQWARKAIVETLLEASAKALTKASQDALKEAAGLVETDELVAARKVLAPLRTRQARAAIAAIKAL